MNQPGEQQYNEFDLINEIHISLIPDLPRWEVKIIETDGFYYPAALYKDLNTAFEGARLIHSSCQQPVTIKIMQENGDFVAVDCERMTQLDVLALIQRIYVYYNGKTNNWEIAASNKHYSFIAGGFISKEQANDTADFIKGINPDCLIIWEGMLPDPDIADNTCRARACKWNVNDSCIQLPRSSSLPLPAVDLSFETWTPVNNPMPRVCSEYSTNMEGANQE